MRTVFVLALALVLAGCSVRQAAVNRIGDALAASGTTFSTDDDPELVRAAAPFSLKLIESLLEEAPQHRGLLLAASRGFTQYAYAFVQQEAEEIEDRDVAESRRLEERARRLYQRARDYGLRGLRLAKADLLHEPRRVVASSNDVPLLYWTAVSWAALIALSKDTELLADLPVVEALIDRALELDEAYERGAIHTFLISYQPEQARRHFARALELSGATQAAPLVALAEAVCVAEQGRAEFERLLKQALEIESSPHDRLANLVAQRRARWLLARTGRLFTE